VQTESGARYVRNRCHIRPAIQNQLRDSSQTPVAPAEPVLPTPTSPVKHPSSTPVDTPNQSLPTQCVPDHTPPSVGAC